MLTWQCYGNQLHPLHKLIVAPFSFRSYKNGSKTREMVRDASANGTWEVRELSLFILYHNTRHLLHMYRNSTTYWTRLIQETKETLARLQHVMSFNVLVASFRLSHISLGIYFQDPEITPAGQGVYRWDSNGVAVSKFPPEVEVRAIVEGQFMAKWVHAKRLGYTLSPSSRVLATGGASKNLKILQARQLGLL